MSVPEPRIRVWWSKKEQDLMVTWDPGTEKSAGRVILNIFSEDVLTELDRRGYDTTTIRFQIRKKPPNVLDRIAKEIG